jgi:hypothetical protein
MIFVGELTNVFSPLEPPRNPPANPYWSCGVRNKRFATPGTAILRLAAARLERRIMRRWEVRRILAAAAIQIY